MHKVICILLISAVCTVVFSTNTLAQEEFSYQGKQNIYLKEKNIAIYKDELQNLNFEDVLHLKFDNNRLTPNLGFSNNNIWLKFKIKNNSNCSKLLLSISYPILNHIELYSIQQDGTIHSETTGDNYAFYHRAHHFADFIFDLNISKGEAKTYFLKIKSGEQIIAPLMVGTKASVLKTSADTELIFAVYLGILLSMFLYNLFVYFLVRDDSYLYYIIYIIFIGLTQATLFGLPFKYLFPNHPTFINQTLIIFPAIAGLAAIQFTRVFLKTAFYTPKLDKGLIIFVFLYILAVVFNAFGNQSVAFRLVDITALTLSIYCFVYTYIIVSKGYNPAKYFLFAWSVFLSSVVIYVLRNVGILPFGNYTNYSILIGTSFEMLTLSLALAARINDLKREKEQSQAKILEALKENERIVTMQNVILEEKVKQRTYQLSESNMELNSTLNSLKEAQIHLVESEKMASLGQLTAGIAHEINNPINFVTSSVVPLKRDIGYILKVVEKYEELHADCDEDKLKEIEVLKQRLEFDYLKQEIDTILKGIEEGANRTAEIIKGLRNFSRVDEGGIKKVDLHAGLDSTLVLLNSSVRDKITIEKIYGNIPTIECQAGKINQVFMNLLSNAIHAVKARHTNSNNGVISIKTLFEEKNIIVSFKDNGIGMSEETQKRIFEPFYTTKGVNEGTGLGMSIVKSTLDKHNAKLTVYSKLGEGSEFILYLPINDF